VFFIVFVVLLTCCVCCVCVLCVCCVVLCCVVCCVLCCVVWCVCCVCYCVCRQGGYWCFDENSCAYRAKTQPYLTSSKTWPSQRGFGGIMNPDCTNNPTFCSFNVVFVPYCSSDGWSGTHTGEGQGFTGWKYHGKYIVRDVFNAFRSQLHEANVLFEGCSAGGQGVIVNADYVWDIVRGFDVKKYVAFSDAGWLMDVTPFDKNILPLREQIDQAAKLWG